MINIFGWTIARVYKIEEYDKIKQQAVESGANEFGMRLKNEELEGQCKNSLEVGKIYVDHINELHAKITNLETDCNDYKEGQGRYEDMIDKLRNKINKLESKIVKLKERR